MPQHIQGTQQIPILYMFTASGAYLTARIVVVGSRNAIVVYIIVVDSLWSIGSRNRLRFGDVHSHHLKPKEKTKKKLI